ncbi:MAG: NUDIX hydrolase [Planctomycetota bacterium]
MSETGIHEDFSGAFGLLERDGCVLLAGNRRRLQPDRSPELIYDLPGGRVEPGETLHEALRRELAEETGLEVRIGEFLMVQEGIRRVGGERRYCWRSYFFRIEADGEPVPCEEIESLLWVPRARLGPVLQAPYHQGFLRWLEDGGVFQRDCWD